MPQGMLKHIVDIDGLTWQGIKRKEFLLLKMWHLLFPATV
jgi:hypothetical protein